MNALTFTRPKSGAYNLATFDGRDDSFKIVDSAHTDTNFAKIYLRSLDVPDSVLDDLAAKSLEKKCRLMIALSRTLEEVGEFDARFSLSPVMFAHRTGLLENCAAVVGGIYIDKDDVDLLVQCGVPLVLTPSFDMGHGHGIPETSMYLKRGLKLALGTEDCSFNPDADIFEEARLLSLVSAATMRDPDAISETTLKQILDAKID